MKGKADKQIVDRISTHLEDLKLDTTTVGEQTVIEALTKMQKRKNWLNPFPKVRYTQRPDVVSAHVTEGKIALIIDNSPTVILIPAGTSLDYCAPSDLSCLSPSDPLLYSSHSSSS